MVVFYVFENSDPSREICMDFGLVTTVNEGSTDFCVKYTVIAVIQNLVDREERIDWLSGLNSVLGEEASPLYSGPFYRELLLISTIIIQKRVLS